MVLTGKLVILAGREKWRSEVGKFAVIAAAGLTEDDGTYQPDFSAEVAEETKCVRISRIEYQKMLETARAEFAAKPAADDDGAVVAAAAAAEPVKIKDAESALQDVGAEK